MTDCRICSHLSGLAGREELGGVWIWIWIYPYCHAPPLPVVNRKTKRTDDADPPSLFQRRVGWWHISRVEGPFFSIPAVGLPFVGGARVSGAGTHYHSINLQFAQPQVRDSQRKKKRWHCICGSALRFLLCQARRRRQICHLMLFARGVTLILS